MHQIGKKWNNCNKNKDKNKHIQMATCKLNKKTYSCIKYMNW